MTPRLQTPDPRTVFKAGVISLTGLSPKVVETWMRAEGGGGGQYNYLNLKAGGRGGGVGYSGVPVNARANGFADFRNPVDAAKETAYWITQMPNYAGVKNAAKKPDGVQLAAIAKSPWDAGHYGGNGQNLLSVYKNVAGSGGGGQWYDTALNVLRLATIPVGAPLGLPSSVPGSGVVSTVAGDVGNAVLGPVEGAAKILVKGLVDVALVLLAAAFLYTGVRKLTGGDASPVPSFRGRNPLPA